ncbi:putative mitochondrial protein [Sesamum angolense]|uniref:Mitochondrial protein n=1 Tax=Sesamum angolense TaxID=2727404 RepID=A0AAE1VZC9_9LAMI|nr:putative mitochondrial protein [Sesamum angolense]
MLAKHLWRLLLYPESLLSRVLKARYFPTGDVFSATLGSHLSFTWRSIMAAQSLFRAGCRWRVGLGTSIRACVDPWLPRSCTFRPITPALDPPATLRVLDLIDPHSLGTHPFHLPTAQPGSVGFREWLLTGSARMDDNEFRLLMCLCWSIWCVVTKEGGGGCCLDPSKVVCFASQYLLSYISQNLVDVVRDVPEPVSKWLAPHPGYIKINFDGATFRKGRN